MSKPMFGFNQETKRCEKFFYGGTYFISFLITYTYKCCAFLLIKAAEEMKIGFVRWKSALILVAEMSQRSKMAFVLSSNVTVKRPYFSR